VLTTREWNVPLECLIAMVRRCITGDSAVWEEITYNRRIYNISCRFAGSGDDAQDLKREGLIQMYRTLPT
jgi:DNA-directed RNA polymerase specialized sigma24 family protein